MLRTHPSGLQHLAISAAAYFVLPDGRLVPAALLAEPQGQRLLQDRWPGASVAAAPGGMLAVTWQPWLTTVLLLCVVVLHPCEDKFAFASS